MKDTINTARSLCVLAVITVLILLSCQKENSASNQQEDATFALASAATSIESDAAFDDVFNNVMGVNEEVAFGETGVFARVLSIDSTTNPCFTVQATRLNAPELFPVKVIIDFGIGCKGRDSVTRKGKIIIVYSGRLTLPGAVAEITFNDYYINNIHIEGFQRIENISTSQALSFKVNITDGKLTMPNGNYSQRTSIYTITQTEGYGTPFWLKDDVLTIEGETNGTAKTDSSFFKWNSKTIEPLMKRFTCPWIVKGKIGLGKTSTGAAIIDYGDGTCDAKATIIINGSTIEISLH